MRVRIPGLAAPFDSMNADSLSLRGGGRKGEKYEDDNDEGKKQGREEKGMRRSELGSEGEKERWKEREERRKRGGSEEKEKRK